MSELLGAGKSQRWRGGKMKLAIGWLCYRIVMAWPLPLPDCSENRAFAWILERAGEYADPMTTNKM